MDWQDATIETIKRLRTVNALAPYIDNEHRRGLYTEARAVALAAAPHDAQKYWNVFINALRIFYAAECETLPSKEVLYGIKDKPTAVEPIRQCPKIHRGRRVRCGFTEDHEGKCDFGG